MAETRYIVTEAFLPGSPQQREQRLSALLAEYRRLLLEPFLQGQADAPGSGEEAPSAAAQPAAAQPAAAQPAGPQNDTLPPILPDGPGNDGLPPAPARQHTGV